jgi:hypothetical protein
LHLRLLATQQGYLVAQELLEPLLQHQPLGVYLVLKLLLQEEDFSRLIQIQ